MQQIQKFLKTPFYFQWLIIFFVLHAYTEFIGFIGFFSLIWFIIKISVAAWILFVAFRKWYGNAHKSALLITIIFSCLLFFGAIQDYFWGKPYIVYLSYYWILVPLEILICLGVLVILFFYKRPITRLARFLNLLLLIYILYDIVLICWKTIEIKKHPAIQPVTSILPVADTIPRPDVYFILLDEYMGNAGLKQYFNYDNSNFELSLKQKGFHVCSKPVSNYYNTIFSIASLLNMRYLNATDNGKTIAEKYIGSLRLLNDNKTCNMFKQLHYTIRNLSPFVVAGINRFYVDVSLPRDIELITDRTAYRRVEKRLLQGDPPGNRQVVALLSKWLYMDGEASMKKIVQQVLSTAGKDSPAFTYIHLLMPHKPYIFDSTGRKVGSFDIGHYKNKDARNDALYLQYLVYTNQRIGRFIDQLYKATQGKAVIMVMSDHGYRDTHGPGSYALRYKTLNAVYLPNRDYRLWYDSVSNVNQFSLLFNTLFKQQIPLLKDSCVYY
jgi:hypothetical protein